MSTLKELRARLLPCDQAIYQIQNRLAALTVNMELDAYEAQRKQVIAAWLTSQNPTIGLFDTPTVGTLPA